MPGTNPNTDSDWLKPLRDHVRKYKILWFLGLFSALLVFFLFAPLLSLLGLDSEHRGQLGETYIVWHSFFDTAACILLGFTLFLQFADVRKRERQFQDQMTAQAFQSVFFPYLTLFQAYVENLECGSLRGRHVFSEWQRSATERLCDDYGPVVEYYHKHLETLLRFIRTGGLSDDEKKKYLTLLHSQLSAEELSVIKRYCNSDGDKNKAWYRRRARLNAEMANVKKVHGDFLESDFLADYEVED